MAKDTVAERTDKSKTNAERQSPRQIFYNEVQAEDQNRVQDTHTNKARQRARTKAKTVSTTNSSTGPAKDGR